MQSTLFAVKKYIFFLKNFAGSSYNCSDVIGSFDHLLANSFTILCLPYSPRTVLATASIFAKLVLYQLLLKCTKCQYGELTVSLIFSADENTRHVSVSHKATPSGITVSGHRSLQIKKVLNFIKTGDHARLLKPRFCGYLDTRNPVTESFWQYSSNKQYLRNLS